MWVIISHNCLTLIIIKLIISWQNELQILKEAEPLEESTSKQGQALWGKFKKLSSFGITLQNMVEEKEEPVYPKVDLDIVYPNAFTPKEVRLVVIWFENLHG